MQSAKDSGASITVETCPHYLAFSAEEIPDGDTRYKCSPPIRDAHNKELLWEALLVKNYKFICLNIFLFIAKKLMPTVYMHCYFRMGTLIC